MPIPASVEEYLAALPEDRQAACRALRDVISENIPEGYEEGIQYGGIGWYVPHSIFPAGYHCNPKEPVPFAGLTNQKGHISLHFFCLYASGELTDWFVEEFSKTGFKLDMGKGCVRFKKMDQIPYELIGRTVARVPVEKFLETYAHLVPTSKRK